MIVVGICLMPVLLQAKMPSVSKPLPDFTSACKHIDIVGTIPDNFSLIEENRVWIMGPIWRRNNNDEVWQKDIGLKGVMGPALQSDDKQCELLINIDLLPMPTEELAGTYCPFYPYQLHHRNILMYDLMSLLDGKTDYRLEDHVTMFGGSEAKERFNADSVFTYSMPIQPLMQDGEEYKYCTRMYIWKNKGSLIYMAWFFTDEGKKEEQLYIDKLNQHIWYVK